MPSMAAILTFAKLTVWETSRRKLLVALLVLTLVVIAGTGFGFSQLTNPSLNDGRPLGEVQVRLIASQLLILVAFMFAAVLALTAVLVAAPSISGDLESNLAPALLARPVRRSEMVLGKWLGLAGLLVAYAAGAGGVELIVVNATTGYVPPHPGQLIAYIAALGLALLTLAMLLSTRLAGMTAGIVPLVCYFMAWICGIVGGIGQGFGNATMAQIGTVSRLVLPTDGLWRGAVYAMEPAAVIAGLQAAGPAVASNPFAATEPPATAFLLWTVAWFALVLGLTLWSMHAKEI